MNFGVLRLRKTVLYCAAAAVMAALVLALRLTGAYAVFTGGTVRDLPVYSVERDGKYVSLSFDAACLVRRSAMSDSPKAVYGPMRGAASGSDDA